MDKISYLYVDSLGLVWVSKIYILDDEFPILYTLVDFNTILIRRRGEKDRNFSRRNRKTTTDRVVERRGRGSECLVGLECLLDIVRALGMGSCLSGDGPGGGLMYGAAAAAAAVTSPSGGRRKDRRKLRKNASPATSSSSNGSANSKIEQWLRRGIPGRTCLNGCSDSASLFTKQGRKGVNQDAMVVWENFGSKEDTIFCGVFDGHGPYGHFVAKKVRDSLPIKLNSMWRLISNSKNELTGGCNDSTASPRSEESPSTPTLTRAHSDKQDESFSTLKASFLKAFRVMDKELKLDTYIDCYCSGSTAVTLVKQGQDLVIGNVGDSRAVLGTRDGDDRYVAVQLTVDLKPNVPREAERIRLRKGRVFALKCEPEVPRVWLPNCDSPGLAMARAFGDFCLKDFGLISVPDVSHHRISEKDEFVVLATDGIWDVLQNNEVVNIVASAPRATAARALVEAAVRVWRGKHPSSKVDDCAVVCLFLSPGGSDTTCVATSAQETVPETANISSSNGEALAPAGSESPRKTAP